MDRIHIINYLANRINAKSYLEVGTGNCFVFDSIKIEKKIGIDPLPERDYIINSTSDNFFKNCKEKFDIIFIDGLHHSDQVSKDIANSLNCLSPNGYIICHNMLPFNEEMQTIPFSHGAWTGDCWKSFVYLRGSRDDLEIFTINTDYGLAIIKKGYQEKLRIQEEINYKNFETYKYSWMNICSIIDFYKRMGEPDILKSLLYHYINFSDSPEINFNLGYFYHSIGQTASAVSYYLRCAERTIDDLLRYECLLRASICFESQGCRNNSVEGMLQHAVALLPKRPEGYFYLSRFYERANKWFHAYTISSIGEKVADKKPSKLIEELDYPGFYGIIFEKAVSAWWTGLCDESRNIFKYLSIYEPLDSMHKQAVISNFKHLNLWKDDSSFISFLKTKEQEFYFSSVDLDLYYKKDFNNLKYKFKGSENIDRNYSEAFQDMFVLTMLDGKTNGNYVEIGSGFPFYGNNTYLLESQFNWKGLSLDINEESSERHFRDRNSIALCKDATLLNFYDILEEIKMPKIIDYLQLDCDPPSITYDILTKIPFDKYKFSVITYEHDYYADDSKSFKQKSRDFLISKGYELVLSNISPKKDIDYEDWYVHPDLVDKNIIDNIKNLNSDIKIAKSIFL